jgi:hypothetical protein
LFESIEHLHFEPPDGTVIVAGVRKRRSYNV